MYGLSFQAGGSTSNIHANELSEVSVFVPFFLRLMFLFVGEIGQRKNWVEVLFFGVERPKDPGVYWISRVICVNGELHGIMIATK